MITEKEIEEWKKYIDKEDEKHAKTKELEKILTDPFNGIYLTLNDIEFYIDAFNNEHFEVYYKNESYKFDNFTKMVNYPLFEGKSTIYNNILEINW